MHCTSACVSWSHSLPALVCCSMTTKQQRLRVGDWEQCCKVYTCKAEWDWEYVRMYWIQFSLNNVEVLANIKERAITRLPWGVMWLSSTPLQPYPSNQELLLAHYVLLHHHRLPGRVIATVTLPTAVTSSLVPGHYHLQSLITCSVQIRRGKDWEIWSMLILVASG